jgi:hypothetical protein
MRDNRIPGGRDPDNHVSIRLAYPLYVMYSNKLTSIKTNPLLTPNLPFPRRNPKILAERRIARTSTATRRIIAPNIRSEMREQVLDHPWQVDPKLFMR